MWYFSWLLSSFILVQINVQSVAAIWPTLNSSSIQLLGLFSDPINASETTLYSVHSRAMFKAAVILSQQYNITIDGQYIEWQAAQTGGDIISALSSTCLIMSTLNIIGIVGPAYSREIHVIAPFAKSIGIPAISYAATDPNLSDRNAYPTFYRTIPSDATAAIAIAELFIRFNWTSCIIIYQNDEYGLGGAEEISYTFNQNGLSISETVIFDIATLSIRGDLRDILSTSLTRIVLLWVFDDYIPPILNYAIDYNVLGPRYTWISRSNIPLNSFNQTSYQYLIGILVIDSVAGNLVNAPFNTTLLNSAYDIWQQYEPETFPGPTKVNDYALFAFDATWLLIQSLQQLCSTNTNISSFCISFLNSSFCFDRCFLNTNTFLNTISATEFLGVSGPIKFIPNVTDRIDGVYYTATNLQHSTNGIEFVPVLKWSYNVGWKKYAQSNLIAWPGNSLIIPTGIAGLAGITLRICIIKSMPFTMQTDPDQQNQTKLIGYIPDLIDLLQNKMGFLPQIILASTNQTYNGLVQSVAHGVCDMVVGDVTVTATRSKIVDFSSPIFDNSLRVIIRQEVAANVDLFSYLRPFSVNLWLILVAGSIFAAVLFCLLERSENESLRNISLISAGAMSMWYSFGNIMGYGVDFHARTAAGRLITAGLYMLSLIVVATYTANLASYLTLIKSKNVVSSIDDIKNGKLSFSRIGIVVGSAEEDYYLREISQGNRNYYPLQSIDEIYTFLLNHIIDASIGDIGYVEYYTNNVYCNLTLVGSDFSQSAFGIVIPKQWLYKKDLDVAILSLREANILDELRKKWFDGKLCQNSLESDLVTRINVASMGGLFLTFAVINILALLLFVWTKRFSIKSYLMRLTCKKKFLGQQQTPQIRRSIKLKCNITHESETTLSVI